MNNKKRLFIILGVILGVSLLLGITYAWFNYTSEGVNQKLIMGDLYLNLTNGNDTISLTNIFPETKEEARAKNDNIIEFSLTGLNESDKDIYYEIKIKHGDEETGKERFDDDDLRFDLIEVNGNNEKYVVANKSYNDLSSGIRIWVDTVDANTTTEIEKNYKLRMWLSEDVIISDSDPNRDYYATGEHAFSNHYASVKVEVFGDFNEKSLDGAYYKTIMKGATLDTTIDFGKISPYNANDLNGQGKQILKGTENDEYPIIYYRGTVNNNNVVFGDFCWQIVRTTDTGGIKMIYNGVATKTGDNYSCNGTAATKGINVYTNYSTNLINGNYGFGRTFSYDISTGYFTIEDIIQENNVNVTWSAANADKLVGTYTCKNLSNTCTRLYYVGYYVPVGYASEESFSIGDLEHYSIIGKVGYNTYNSPMSTSGYAYNEIYLYTNEAATSGAYFGNDIEYGDFDSNGTDEYRLVSSTASTTKDYSHHYTCNSTIISGTCESVRYYYYDNMYINLSNGEKIEDAIYKMRGSGESNVISRNNNYELNNVDSVAKSMLEIWYKNNLTNEVDNTKTNYTNYLEDTVYCNDREIESGLASSGFNPNGGSLSGYLYFDNYNRANNMSIVNIPKMTCSNEFDRFSLSNNKAKLKYPVGLLTSDEIILAGGKMGTANNSFYLYTGFNYWSMSPFNYYGANSVGFKVADNGTLTGGNFTNSEGLRPVVSLKLGTEFVEGGTGTTANPYIVKYN